VINLINEIRIQYFGRGSYFWHLIFEVYARPNLGHSMHENVHLDPHTFILANVLEVVLFTFKLIFQVHFSNKKMTLFD
jgi:hypothetical protein